MLRRTPFSTSCSGTFFCHSFSEWWETPPWSSNLLFCQNVSVTTKLPLLLFPSSLNTRMLWINGLLWETAVLHLSEIWNLNSVLRVGKFNNTIFPSKRKVKLGAPLTWLWWAAASVEKPPPGLRVRNLSFMTSLFLFCIPTLSHSPILFFFPSSVSGISPSHQPLLLSS